MTPDDFVRSITPGVKQPEGMPFVSLLPVGNVIVVVSNIPVHFTVSFLALMLPVYYCLVHAANENSTLFHFSSCIVRSTPHSECRGVS